MKPLVLEEEVQSCQDLVDPVKIAKVMATRHAQGYNVGMALAHWGAVSSLRLQWLEQRKNELEVDLAYTRSQLTALQQNKKCLTKEAEEKFERCAEVGKKLSKAEAKNGVLQQEVGRHKAVKAYAETKLRRTEEQLKEAEELATAAETLVSSTEARLVEALSSVETLKASAVVQVVAVKEEATALLEKEVARARQELIAVYKESHACQIASGRDSVAFLHQFVEDYQEKAPNLPALSTYYSETCPASWTEDSSSASDAS